MEEDDPQSGASLLPIALAVFGVVLGGAALYFGLTANQRLAPLSESLEAGSSSAARFEKEIASLETRLSEVSAELSDTNAALTRLRAYGSQSEQAIKRLASDVGTNREQIIKTAEQLNQLAATSVRAPVEATAPSPAREVGGSDGASAAGSGSSGGSPGASFYTIEAGDTLARVAAQKGVGLQALLDANPDVDPRRLRIGQQIRIPSNQ